MSAISRRDFLNGIALGLATTSALGSKSILAAAIADVAQVKDDYPPALTGLRGSHDGSFEVAHQLAWAGQKPEEYEALDEHYDLIVVGGGISGLAAAYFYRQINGEDKRVLILDNHDDFGGHAKRNEFHRQGNMLLGFGGSINIEHPENYSDVSSKLLMDLGINLEELNQALDPDYPFATMAQTLGTFVPATAERPAEIVSGQWLAAFHGIGDYESLFRQLPIDSGEQSKLIDFVSGDRDFLSDYSLMEKWDYLTSTSYHRFLIEKVGLQSQTVALFDPLIRLGHGIGGDSLSVWEVINSGAAGLKAVGWLGNLVDKLAFDPEEPYRAEFFPDGNASIARLLVRRLVPEVAPGKDMHDIVDARFDYSKLDLPNSNVRVRLNSTAVNVKQPSDKVRVRYVQHGKPCEVTADKTILACYNGLIPHLCPQLPEKQKENLKYGVKVPFVWANVLLRSGTPFYQAGAQMYKCVDSYFDVVTKAPPTKLGAYQPSNNPEDPLVVFMGATVSPVNDGSKTDRDLFRLGRHQLYSTPFSEYEKQIRHQLTEMFAPHGFDADRDIEAITVNRWSHGYAYSYSDLYDPDWKDEDLPHVIGRKAFGNISIANSDSEAYAYVNGAIDAAWRAVTEQS